MDRKNNESLWFDMSEWEELPKIHITREDIKGTFQINFNYTLNEYYDQYDEIKSSAGLIQYELDKLCASYISIIEEDSKCVSISELDLSCGKFTTYLRRDLDDIFYSGLLWENISN